MLLSVAALANLLCGEVLVPSFHCSFTSGWQTSTACPRVKVCFYCWERHNLQLREASLSGAFIFHAGWLEQSNLVQ